MTFKKLAEFFQELETTASRNTMVEILAKLFKEASEAEIAKIVYLMQGRVAPLFEPVEFGMADRMVIKALALAFNVKAEQVTELFKKAGDIGEVSLKLSEKSRVGQNVDVNFVFEKLGEITQASGEGSVEKKISLLSDLLKKSDPVSAKFLARIPVDKLRLGFSDMTVLEGLAWMLSGSKKEKSVLEAAYNIRPDLGFIAESVKKNGVTGVAHVKPKLGTPILVMRAERLTSPEEIISEIGKCAVEPKLDGLRTQLHLKKDFVRLFSRGLENVTEMYPDLLKAASSELKDASEIILDGEAIGFDPKTGKYLGFQETTQRKRKHDVETFSKSIPVKFVVFDILVLNGENLINEPYEKRRALVEKITNIN